MLDILRRFLVRLCDPNASTVLEIQHPSRNPTPALVDLPTDLPAVESQIRPEDVPLPEDIEPFDAEGNGDQAVVVRDDESDLDLSLIPFSLPSPLLRLPPEILSSIFATVCHADFDKFLSDKNKHRRTTPFVLGKTCKHWRDIVWCTPHIWSHISLSLNTSRYEDQVTLFEGCLSRSGVCLLTMNLTFDNEDLWSHRMPTRLIGLLVKSAQRWKAINFIIPESWYSPLQEITNDLLALITVSTQPLWSDCGLSPSKRKRLTLFGSAPRLNDLHLNGYYVTDVDITWSQLTRFTLQHVYLDECFYALSRTPHLTYCRIFTILANDVGREVVETDITLYFLQKLIINSAYPDDMARILHLLHAPSLETLEISAPQSAVELGSYAKLITEAGCKYKLRVLKLLEFNFVGGENNLLLFLDTFPNLEEVRLDLSFDEDQPLWELFITLLAERGRGKDRDKGKATCDSDKARDHLHPPTYRFLKLERFSLTGNIVPPPQPDRALIDAIARRWEGQCKENNSELPFVRLRCFDLVGNSTALEPDDYGRHLEFFKSDIDELREKGMRIQMKLNPKWPSE